MRASRFALTLAGACLASLGACGSPSRPSVTVVAGTPVSPANGAQLSYYSQPITLVARDGITTSGTSTTSLVEVATDTGFAALVATKALGQAGQGQLAVTLDWLNAETTYYWRVRTTEDQSSSTSPAYSFAIGQLLVIQPPAPVQPLADSFPHKRPAFVVRNAVRTGPTASLTYTFEIGTDAGFPSIVASGDVPEAPDQTSFTPAMDLVPGATYFWRARGRDAVTTVIGPFSPAQAFTIVYPEDGSYRYTLVVRSPAWCRTHATYHGSGFCGGSGTGAWSQLDFSFDGFLEISGDTLRYPLPPGGGLYDRGPFTLEMRRASNRLAGSIAGSTRSNWFEYYTATMNGVVSGESDNRGRFDGAFDGGMELWRFGFPCDVLYTCSPTTFSWTLLPH